MHPSRDFDRLRPIASAPAKPTTSSTPPSMLSSPFQRLRTRCLTCSPRAATLSPYVWSAKWLRDNEGDAAKQHNMSLSQLMVKAGTAAYEVIDQLYRPSSSSSLPLSSSFAPTIPRWVILAGAGNNGGDGYVIARLAKASGREVTVVEVNPKAALPVEATAAKEAWIAVGGTTLPFSPTLPALQPDYQADVVVDALLGTGLTGAPRGAYAEAIQLINQMSAPRVAIDIPSGLDAETGRILGSACVMADHTVSFLCLKPGQLTGQSRATVGQLHYATLGVEDWTERQLGAAVARRLCLDDLPSYFSVDRSETSHKGSHGRVLLIGGERGYGGAILMAAEAAVASGAGLTRVLTRPEHVTSLLTRCPEVMVRGVENEESLIKELRDGLLWCDAVGVGPGLGDASAFARVAMEEVLSHAKAFPAKPVIIDADGLNLLARNEVTLPSHPSPQLVVTPHPGEAARLLHCSVAEVEADRFSASERIAKLVGGVCLLKGPGTVVCQHVAAGEQSCAPPAILDVGNAGMAVGGMGDVLTGVVTSLAAQGVGSPTIYRDSGVSPLFHAVCAGGLVHSLAADCLREVEHRGARGIRPTDLFSWVTYCVNP